MAAYYNEFDPFAAAWLRQLISAGHIAPGDVDERSIEDVCPEDIKAYKQCHFFAGIGVWSLALRNVGFPDDARIWTGSCPCQPFSAAGKGGGFADERHLWPAFYHLILNCEPERVAGEQVASLDGLAWLDTVQTDMEIADYAFGAVDTCAAGFGAPHIRQRLYWMADANTASERVVGTSHKPMERGGEGYSRIGFGGRSSDGRMGDDDDAGLERQRSGYQTKRRREGSFRPIATAGEFGGLADIVSNGRGERRQGDNAGNDGAQLDADGCNGIPSPTNGFWGNADWLFCRDGKWRPVEPGTFPLVNGTSNRVGRLRGYGNAINLAQAEGFLKVALQR